MKRWRSTLALFLFFVGVVSGVRYLDDESRLYEYCVNSVLNKATAINLRPHERDFLLSKVQTPGARFNFQGQTCPRLLRRHTQIIEAHLLGRSEDLPAGVPPFGVSSR